MPEPTAGGDRQRADSFVRVRSLRVAFPARGSWAGAARLRPERDVPAAPALPYVSSGRSVEDGGFQAVRSRKRGVTAVNDVSLAIDRGRTLGLVGESGCGKTTLGRALLRLLPVAAGDFRLGGVDVFSLHGGALRRFRRRMQMIFQDPSGSLNPRMTVRGIVGDPMAAHGLAARKELHERVADLLRRVGLQPEHMHRYPHELSGGQRQRVGIARALALDPEFVVCDEPVRALDVPAQAEILDLLGELRHRLGLSYLFITHNLAVAERFSDGVAVMYAGRIMEIGPAADVFSDARHPYTLALRAAVPAADPARPGGLVPLGGEPPSPFDPPAGCPFHPRCRFATKECSHDLPALSTRDGLAPGHLVACLHADRTLSCGEVHPG